MLAALADRPLAGRALASALFALVLASFALPWATIASDRRRSEPSGIALALDRPSYSGRYVHDAYRGEVERLVADGHAAALVAIVIVAAACVLVWLPWRLGPAAGVALAVLTGLAFLGLYQATRSTYSFADTDRRFGFWLALLLLVAAGAWSAAFLARTPFWWKPGESSNRDYFASRDGA